MWLFSCVLGKVAKVLKMLVSFPNFWAFVGWLILVYLGLEGLGVFVVLVCFSFVQVLLLFVLACFCFVVGLLLVLLCLGFCAFFLNFFWGGGGGFLLFVGGFKGQVRWPKGPPYLALNPPYFLFCLFVFLLCLFFVLFVFVFVWRVQGSGEVAQMATSLGPKPSIFFVFFCVCVIFLAFRTLLSIEKPCFPVKRPFLLFILVFPFVSL